MMARFGKRKLILFILFVVFIIIYKFGVGKSNTKFDQYLPSNNFSGVIDPYTYQNSGNFKKKEDRKIKTILLFTTHFYSDVWKGLHPDVLDDYTNNAKCEIQECVISYDKRKIATADVVVFHGVDFGFRNYTSVHFHALSKIRPSYQRWLFWMHETPVYYPETENYNNIFNWTMTFSRQSDIYHPYYSYKPYVNEDRPAKYNHATGKNGKVAWMVSHCGMTREEYVMELQKYTDVTVYGLCGASYDKMGGICSKVEAECMQELSRYKFYLAFENSFCDDYITEKYYKFGLMYGLVPIVMGAHYDNLNSVPGSYIDVSDFSSIEELGSYINYLDQHDSEYNKYFEWTQYFQVTDGIDKVCLICNAAHDESRKENIYSNFNSFWSAYQLCDPYDSVKQKLSKQVEASKLSRKEKDIGEAPADLS